MFGKTEAAGLLGVLHGAEPVAMQLKFAPERLDQRRERTLVA